MRPAVRYVLVLMRLAVSRTLASPGLLVIRFSGVLVAVILVSGVALYSGAMGDAMLQASLRADQGSSNVVTSATGIGMNGEIYARLDQYVRRQESRDLGLPLAHLAVHHNTSTMALYRDSAFGHAGAPAPFAYLTLDYYAGLRDQVLMVAGTLEPPPGSGGAVPVVVSQYTAQSLHLSVGERLAYSADGHTRLGPPLVVAGV